MTVTEPELVRISILGGNTQVDVALPATAPIAALMPAVLDYLRVPEPPCDAQAPPVTLPRWTLAAVGAPPMPPSGSLSDCGVRDGDLLVVHRNLPTAPGAFVDDVVDGMAHLTGRNSAAWSAESARRVGYGVAVLGTLTAATSGWCGAAAGGTSLIGVLAAAAPLAVVLVAAALIAARLGTDRRTVATLSVCAFIMAALAGSTVPQLASQTDESSWPAAAAAAAACALTSALIAHRCTGVAHRLHAALITFASCVGVAALLAMTADDVDTPRGLSQICVAASVAGIFVIALAARIAIAASRLPLPPVPSTSPSLSTEDYPDTEAIEGVGAVRKNDDQLGAIAALALVDLDALERRSAIAADYLTGIIAGASAATVTAAATAALLSGGQIKTLVLCAVVAVALLARGRTHVDALQSGILATAGALTAAATALGTGSWVAAFIGGIGITCAALVLGTAASSYEANPMQRRAAEISEYAVLVLAVPLLLWVLDVYQSVREI